MPHVGSQFTDPLAVSLIQQWITQLPTDTDQLVWLDELCGPYRQIDRDKRLASARKLLQSTAGAMRLSAAIAEGRVPQSLVHEIVEASLQAPSSMRDLLEPFATAGQRTPRLGDNFDLNLVLNCAGDVARGKKLFESGVGTCLNCHQAGTIGKPLGPDLGQSVAKLKTRQAILENIVRPSAEIHQDFVTRLVLTEDGELLTGYLLEQTSEEIALRDANGNVSRLPLEMVANVRTSAVSLMPENLLAPLSAQQAADLLAFIESLASDADAAVKAPLAQDSSQE
jgi:putative heme-binding domain-containing protein